PFSLSLSFSSPLSLYSLSLSLSLCLSLCAPTLHLSASLQHAPLFCFPPSPPHIVSSFVTSVAKLITSTYRLFVRSCLSLSLSSHTPHTSLFLSISPLLCSAYRYQIFDLPLSQDTQRKAKSSQSKAPIQVRPSIDNRKENTSRSIGPTHTHIHTHIQRLTTATSTTTTTTTKPKNARYMSSAPDMASPPLQFESDPALMANNSGSNYGGYSPFSYQTNMGYPNTYPVNSATPPSLPPMSHGSSYTSGSNNFQFPYHTDGSSAPPTSGALPSSSAPLSTPSTQASDPLDGSHHPSHSPHTQQSQPHGATPPQQHPQTPGQVRAGGHNPHGASPYQNSPHHTMGMNNLMHGHAIYPGDARYQQPQRNYVDPMPMMGGRNGSRSGEMWAQPNGMMSDLLNTHPGGVRNPGPQGRQTKQGLGLNNMGMAMNGMGPMSPMGGLGMPGMPGMNPMGGDRMSWGGMVGTPTPYGHNGHPQYNMQGHPQYQNSHLAHPQSMQQHLGPHGRVGGMGPNQG
ncbi:MAG: hypothetical protein BYD32DRAFT_79648, partial [Podila humilis]